MEWAKAERASTSPSTMVTVTQISTPVARAPAVDEADVADAPGVEHRERGLVVGDGALGVAAELQGAGQWG